MRSVWFGPFGRHNIMTILKFIPKGMVFIEKRFSVSSICKSESLDASKPRSLAASRRLGGNPEAKSISKTNQNLPKSKKEKKEKKKKLK